MVGKDILRFHAVYWPAFLMAAGIEVPRRVFAHGWWTSEGQKISKSLGNVILPSEIVARYGLDQVRYTLMREVSFGNDGDFSHRGALLRCNHDLANDYGNLAQRVLKMVARNCEGRVPVPAGSAARTETCSPGPMACCPHVRGHIEVQAIHLMLREIWAVIGAANRYVDAEAPWKLKQSDPGRMATVLFCVAEVIRVLALLTQPVMPDSSSKLLDQLAVPADWRNFACIDEEHALRPGTLLPEPSGVFPRRAEEAG